MGIKHYEWVEVVQRQYEFGVLFHLAGRFYALRGFDPDGPGPVGGYWGLVGLGEQFVPFIGPLPGLGYCLQSVFEYPGEIERYETVIEGTAVGVAFRDSQGRPVFLDGLEGTWSGSW